jgi:hypothetical protein
MALKSYVFVEDFKSPVVTATGLPHNPQKIRLKRFRKGDIVKGELKHANNKPAFLLVNGVCVVPLYVVKELITKQIVSNATGTTDAQPMTTQVQKVETNAKVKYIDSMLIGAVVGLTGVIVAEKQGWIGESDSKYKLYGALVGAVAGAYFVFRTNNSNKQKIKLKQD